MDQIGVKLTKESYTNQYNTTFSRNEINQECNKYFLGFVPAKEFRGQFSLEFLAKLKNFISEKNITISDYDLKTSLYVLAPRTNNTSKVVLKKDIKDPLFFFQIEHDYFVLLDGSKDYITLTNAWAGFKNKSEGRCRVAYTIENMLIGSIVFFIFAYLYSFSLVLYWLLLPLLLLSFSVQFIRYAIRADLPNFDKYGWSSKQYPIS